jgi:hypothetical protein
MAKSRPNTPPKSPALRIPASEPPPSTSTISKIPETGTRGTLTPSIKKFLEQYSTLHLGGDEDFHAERRKHLDVFGIHSIPKGKQHPIGDVEFTAVRGPHDTIPVRVLYPKGGEEKKRKEKKKKKKKKKKGEAGALVYVHGGGYTVGSVDESHLPLHVPRFVLRLAPHRRPDINSTVFPSQTSDAAKLRTVLTHAPGRLNCGV